MLRVVMFRNRITHFIHDTIRYETRERCLQFIMFFTYLLEIAISVFGMVWESKLVRIPEGSLLILFSICAIVSLSAGRLRLERVFCIGITVLILMHTFIFLATRFDGGPISSEIIMNHLLQITLFSYRIFSVDTEEVEE